MAVHGVKVARERLDKAHEALKIAHAEYNTALADYEAKTIAASRCQECGSLDGGEMPGPGHYADCSKKRRGW